MDTFSETSQRHIHVAQSIQSNTRQARESTLRPFGYTLQPYVVEAG
jgi:hypothetical protein